ncbi:MAG: hypothetical protein JSW63_03475 [Ignavibacterium sp.]|nr:MAG: hypothetical protein JSW63_03475 [Ignavibacterium sp.]
MKLLQRFKFFQLAITTLLFSFIFISDISAQAEPFAFGGYMTFSRMSVAQGDVQFSDGPNYGLGLDYHLRSGTAVELLWVTTKTDVRLRKFNTGITEDLFTANVHYFNIGVVQEFNPRKKARPFFAFTGGATVFSPTDPNISDEWFASITLGGGGKFDLSKSIGIRLQARMLVPLRISGGGLWIGTGGASVGVGSWAPIVQFDFTAGIYVKLGRG